MISQSQNPAKLALTPAQHYQTNSDVQVRIAGVIRLLVVIKYLHSNVVWLDVDLRTRAYRKLD
jgi:hypothetical protein